MLWALKLKAEGNHCYRKLAVVAGCKEELLLLVRTCCNVSGHLVRESRNRTIAGPTEDIQMWPREEGPHPFGQGRGHDGSCSAGRTTAEGCPENVRHLTILTTYAGGLDPLPILDQAFEEWAITS